MALLRPGLLTIGFPLSNFCPLISARGRLGGGCLISHKSICENSNSKLRKISELLCGFSRERLANTDRWVRANFLPNLTNAWFVENLGGIISNLLFMEEILHHLGMYKTSSQILK